MDTFKKMNPMLDAIIALDIPTEFNAVGEFYEEFDQVSDEEVMIILSDFKNKGKTYDSN